MDPVLLQVLLQRRRNLNHVTTITRAAVQATTLLLGDDDEDKYQASHGGSKPGKQPNLCRDFEGSYQRLWYHYLSAEPLYGEETFRRRFRMARPLFLKLVDAVESHDPYFTHRPDATGKWGLKPIVKIIAALRMLAYRGAANCNEELLQISESTSLDAR